MLSSVIIIYNINMNKRKLKLFLAINCLIAILEIIGNSICFREIGWSTFIYYTQLSNLFLLAAAIVNIAAGIKSLKNKRRKIPDGAFRLFHVATSATTVTILVVIFVLSWMYGDLIHILTAGSMLYTHTLCPFLAVVTHFAFAPKVFTKKAASRALLFTITYATVAIILNALRIWHGPYPFLFIYEQPIWMSIMWIVVMLAGAYGISRALLVGKIKK